MVYIGMDPVTIPTNVHYGPSQNLYLLPTSLNISLPRLYVITLALQIMAAYGVSTVHTIPPPQIGNLLVVTTWLPNIIYLLLHND